MKRLTNKEKEIMDLYWQHGPMFVRELLEHYAEASWRRMVTLTISSMATPTSTSLL